MTALVHDRSLEAYGFGGDHPFNPLRIRLTFELCDALGLLEGHEMLDADLATDEDLTTVHSLTYVRMVQQAGEADLGDLMS
ncbi:MAG: acetoin utilization protein AcuC, partial [Rubrobacteraceae bacterium]